MGLAIENKDIKKEWLSDGERILRSGSVFFISGGAVSVLAYLFQIFAARFLSVPDYGTLQTILSFLNLWFIPVTIMVALLTRVMAENKKDGREKESFILRRDLRAFFLFPGSLFLLFFFGTIPFWERFFNMDSAAPFIFAGLTLYLTFFQGINGSTLNGWHYFFEVNFGLIANGALKLLSGAIFMLIGWGAAGGTAGVFLGFSVHILIGDHFVSKRFRKMACSEADRIKLLSRTKLKKLPGYVYPIAMGMAAITIFSNIDVLIAKNHFDPIEAGKYGALFTLSKIIFFSVSSLALSVIPLVAAENDPARRKRYLLLILLASTLVSAAGVVLFFLFPEFIIELLFGRKYLGIAGYLGKFGILAFLLSLLNVFVQYFISLKRKMILFLIFVLSGAEVLLLWFFGFSFPVFFLIILIILAATDLLCLAYALKSL